MDNQEFENNAEAATSDLRHDGPSSEPEEIPNQEGRAPEPENLGMNNGFGEPIEDVEPINLSEIAEELIDSSSSGEEAEVFADQVEYEDQQEDFNNGFDPEIHQTKDGEPVLNKDGSFRKKLGRKKSNTAPTGEKQEKGLRVDPRCIVASEALNLVSLGLAKGIGPKWAFSTIQLEDGTQLNERQLFIDPVSKIIPDSWCKGDDLNMPPFAQLLYAFSIYAGARAQDEEAQVQYKKSGFKKLSGWAYGKTVDVFGWIKKRKNRKKNEKIDSSQEKVAVKVDNNGNRMVGEEEYGQY